MSPVGRSWRSHVRCLAEAIAQRGSNHVYSKSNFRLLVSTRLILTLQALSTPDLETWQQSSPVRSTWAKEVESALGSETHSWKLGPDGYELYDPLDSIMSEVGKIRSIMAQLDAQVSDEFSSELTMETDYLNYKLLYLYESATCILSENEARLALWKPRISKVSLAAWSSRHTDPVSSHFCSHMTGKGLCPCFDQVFTFCTMLDYQSVSLYWTIIMLLRLVLTKILRLMGQSSNGTWPFEPHQQMRDERIQLIKYTINVLQTVCYAVGTESREASPFVVVTSFQLAIAVLEREQRALRSEAGSDAGEIERCDRLKGLATQYLDWAAKNKISVRMDLRPLEGWDFVYHGLA